jgi:hypothetical protein
MQRRTSGSRSTNSYFAVRLTVTQTWRRPFRSVQCQGYEQVPYFLVVFMECRLDANLVPFMKRYKQTNLHVNVS